MGSTGSGRFSDYNGYEYARKGETGGDGDIDKCARAFSVDLEDIENCEYYIKKGKCPDIDSAVYVVFEKRIVAKSEEGLTIGYLPTERNYLRYCMEKEYSYEGIVIGTEDMKPIKNVTVTITPSYHNEK